MGSNPTGPIMIKDKIRKIFSELTDQEFKEYWLETPIPDFQYRTPSQLNNEELEKFLNCLEDYFMGELS